MQPEMTQPFDVILKRVVDERTRELEISPKQISERLGPDYRSLMHWLKGDRWFPAELLPKLCLELKDFSLLDELEHQVGRVAYPVPQSEHFAHMEDVQAIQRLIKEVGEAISALARTLEDGIVEQRELDETLPELDDVIRECARLKHWLRERHKGDFAPRRRKLGQA
jgi:hypothetical protein